MKERNEPIAVLFVDDEPAVLRMIARVLANSRLAILTAPTATAALRLLDERRIDVLVSDIEMAEMDGIELLQIVRRDHPNVLRMLLSGATTVERALRAINEGEVTRFFTKPFEVELFREAMEALTPRITQLRRGRAEMSSRDRQEELHRWLDRRYPGLLLIARTVEGDLIVDVPGLVEAVEATGSPAVQSLLRRE